MAEDRNNKEEKVANKEALKAQKKREKKQKRREKHGKKWEKQRRLLFPANKKGKHVCHGMNFFRCLLYPIQALLFPYKMYGNTEAAEGACIYVGNHYSMIDIFYPARTTWEVVHYVAKQSVLEAPGFGYLARRYGAIGVMRDGTDVRSVMECIKVLKNGEKLIIFPEGTRNRVSETEFLPFHGSSTLLAIRTKTPIVPFVICKRPRAFHRTHVVFGAPITFEEFYDKKLTQEEQDAAEEKLRSYMYSLRDEHLASLEKKKKGKKK